MVSTLESTLKEPEFDAHTFYSNYSDTILSYILVQKPVTLHIYAREYYFFTESCPKRRHNSFYLKITFLKKPKSHEVFDNFCKKICRQELSKIAHSGHTGHTCTDG